MAHKILEVTGEEHKRLKVSGSVLFIYLSWVVHIHIPLSLLFKPTHTCYCINAIVYSTQLLI